MGKTKTWAERVEALVQKLGSREAVAVKLGVSYFTVMRWASGAHTPSPLAAANIEALEKKMDSF